MNPKYLVVTLLLAFFYSANSHALKTEYNQALAEKLGADDYGMKSYVMVILTTGDVELEDKEAEAKAFAGHFSNMARLAEEGKLAVAGPFVDARPKRGLFIFNVESLEEAEALVKTDPAVQVGIFNYELAKLYSSAALMLINDYHPTLQKKSM